MKFPSLQTIQLDYLGHKSLSHYFKPFANKPWSIALSSGNHHSPQGRYDIIACQPFITLTGHKNACHRVRGNEKTVHLQPCFDMLEDVWLSIARDPESGSMDVPFNGGAMGYFSYDLAQETEQTSFKAMEDPVPHMAVGFYDWAIFIDHHQERVFIRQFGLDSTTNIQRIVRFIEQYDGAAPQPFTLSSPWKASTPKTQYDAAFAQINDHIHKGNCYQVNYAQQFSAHYSGDEWLAFERLMDANKAPFSAFMRLEDHCILSVSPERFLKVDKQRVETRPIKGTRKREADPLLDAQQAQALMHSEKDRAENLMIVDLLRNDLGKTCSPGSIKVPQLYELESFEAVHHLVSTVEGRLNTHSDAIQLFKRAFPGGSITGTPKRRAIEIIDELEPFRRSIYCGSIAYIDCMGQIDSNIAIRTLLCKNQQIHTWGGGGLVWDSECELEYQESIDKLNKILPILSGMA